MSDFDSWLTLGNADTPTPPRGHPTIRDQARSDQAGPSDQAIGYKVVPSDQARSDQAGPCEQAIRYQVVPSDQARSDQVLPRDQA